MRVGSQTTLAHYLQEVVASTTLSAVSPPAKAVIKSYADKYDDIMKITVLRLRAGQWAPLRDAL